MAILSITLLRQYFREGRTRPSGLQRHQRIIIAATLRLMYVLIDGGCHLSAATGSRGNDIIAEVQNDFGIGLRSVEEALKDKIE